MRIKLLILTLLFTCKLYSQTNITADSLNRNITNHFKKYTAELYRYAGLSMYGESKTTFSQSQIDEELALFEQLKASDLINKPTKIVFALNHNLLIHSSTKGEELLSLLNKPTKDSDIIRNLYMEMFFAGEFGEKLVLKNLLITEMNWDEVWAHYLKTNGIYDTSLPQIKSVIQQTNNLDLKLDLTSSLMYIGSPKSIGFVKNIIDTTRNDLLQTKSIFVYAELTGFNGITTLEQVNPVGEKSESEKKGSIDWLKKETNLQNIYGTEVSNDLDFVYRFGDIHSPAMLWLENKGLLKDKALKNPTALTKAEKNQILDLLIDSKCFGLEAIKGALFLSINKTDIDKLKRLRLLNYYSPNRFTKGRGKTLGILIRYLKKR
jgi:hypothetical protein